MEDVIDLEHWGRDQTTTPIPQAKTYQTRLWDGDGFDEKRSFNDDDVTGQQVLERYDRRPTSEFELLMLTRRGDLERVDLHQTISLRDKGPERFFAFRADRLFTFTVNGRRYPWGAPTIVASLIRRLARIPDDHTLYLEKAKTPDEALGGDSVVTLTGSGVETLSSRKAEWKLNVQGVLLTLASPFIAVKDALAQAGFDPNQGWIAILKRKGAPKQQVELCDTIDLRLPGIEKLRLTPAEINNGEAPAGLRQDFALLEKDTRYLDARAFVWETLIDGGRRWLFLRQVTLPNGFNHGAVDIAIDIPATYPSAEIDMFHCRPHLTRAGGGQIPYTTGSTQIQGETFQQWSRHLRGRTRWNPATDSVMTHIALIEAALLKEVGEP